MYWLNQLFSFYSVMCGLLTMKLITRQSYISNECSEELFVQVNELSVS